MIRRFFPLVIAVAFVASCGSKSPAEPTPPPATVTPTRIIVLVGSLGFSATPINTTQNATWQIRNDGNDVLTITGMQITAGLGSIFASGFTSGTIPARGTQNVTIGFTPTAVQTYSGTITVNGNQTSGTNTASISGTGIFTGPIWTLSGTGDSVFDMPLHVRRVRITASTAASCSNFVVRIAGSLTVNVILGTCSVADSRSHDGTYLTSGGVTAVTISSGVNWTFTEVR